MYSDNPVADAMADQVSRDGVVKLKVLPQDGYPIDEAAYYAGVTEDLFDASRAIDYAKALRSGLKAIQGARKAA